MISLLDANVLIDADRDYYPIERVPEFWEWLAAMGEQGLVKVPQEVYEAVTGGNDALAQWIKEHRDALLLDEAVDMDLVRQVTYEGYASNLTDIEIEQLNEDPFLVAYALAAPGQRRVISNENSRPSARRANRKVPDVCDDFEVVCWHAFRFFRELDFRTDWRNRL